MINSLNKNIINEIDLTNLSTHINSDTYKSYFLKSAGEEHYKILAYFSTLYNNTVILDIGTHMGCSALALSYNPSNKILSFDIVNNFNLNSHPANIEFIIDDILEEKYVDIIKKIPFISLDIAHDGTVEQKFHALLQKINWKGSLFLDDIYLNDEMKKYWNSIKEEKYDITEFGHFSGSGIVLFT